MPTNDLLLGWIVGLPLVGSVILPFLGKRSPFLRNALALLLVLIPLGLVVALLPSFSETSGTVAAFDLGGIGIFQADRLAIFMALVSLFVGAVIVYYSFEYISHYAFQNEYYFMVVLFLGAMMGIVFSQNLIFLFIFWEITALACWRLIGFFREETIVLKADKAFLVTVFGALVMLIGFIQLYSEAGSFNLQTLKIYTLSHPVSNLTVLLILFGIFSKSATLPLHTWLPDAGVAPSPVTALLHAAVLVKIGVYVYARLFGATLTIDPIWHTAVPVIVAVSALVSAGAALIETDLKRIIAFSTISQLAFIFLGLAIGGDLGLVGGLLYIFMHSLAKGGLFLCAGIVEQRTHCKDITKLGGLITTMPITAASFLLCAFSVMGIPPFGGFFSKYMVIAGTVNSGHPWIALTFIVGAVFTILYLMRVFTLVFLPRLGAAGEITSPASHSSHEGRGTMVTSVALLALLSLLCGIWVQLPTDFVSSAVKFMRMGILQ